MVSRQKIDIISGEVLFLVGMQAGRCGIISQIERSSALGGDCGTF